SSPQNGLPGRRPLRAARLAAPLVGWLEEGSLQFLKRRAIGLRDGWEDALKQQELGSYGQFCPVAMAAEVICSRWTMLVLRELLCGSTRFNDLRRGVPLMSPTLLSKRLKELEKAGVIMAVPSVQSGVSEYRLTAAGEDLRPVVMSLGFWGQRWVEYSLSLKNLDPSLLMWDMRRRLDPTPLPPRRCTINFLFPEIPSAKRSWW